MLKMQITINISIRSFITKSFVIVPKLGWEPLWTKGTPPAQPLYNSTLTIIPSIKNTMLISVRSAQGTPSIRSICNSASKPHRLVREASTINDEYFCQRNCLYIEVSTRSFETFSHMRSHECIRDVTQYNKKNCSIILYLVVHSRK